MIRILIVDDSASVRGHLRRLVERNPEWEVCGEARDGREAVYKALDLIPDLVLLDYRLPAMNGLQVGREISRLAPLVKILLCSMHVSSYLNTAARRAQIHGTVSKSEPSQIINAIEAILRNETFFTSEAMPWLA